MTWRTCDRRPMLTALARNAEGIARLLCVQAPACLSSIALHRPRQLLGLVHAEKLKRLSSNLYLLKPQVWLSERWMQKIGFMDLFRHEFATQIIETMHHLGMEQRRLIAWIFKPDQLKWLGLVKERYVLYECHDEYQLDIETGQLLPHMRDMEMDLLTCTDLVLATSAPLWRKRSLWHPKVHLVPNGVDVEHFIKARKEPTPVAPELMEIKRPVIGYPGNISRFVDIELLEYISEMRPQWSLVLLGEVAPGVSLGNLRHRRNVHLLGWQPYERLPAFSKGFEVVILPFLVNEYLNSSNPLVVWEQLAAGNPIVATNFTLAREYAQVVSVVQSKEEFVLKIEEALTEDNSSIREKALMLSREHSWEKVTRKSLNLLVEEFGK